MLTHLQPIHKGKIERIGIARRKYQEAFFKMDCIVWAKDGKSFSLG